MLKRTKAFLSLITAAVILSSCGASGSSSSSSEGDSSSEAPTTAVKVTLPQDSSVPDSSDSSQDDSSQDGEQQSSITPHMWKLTADNGHTITFIGSMHALAEDSFPLPDRVLEPYKEADAVVCELDLYGFSNNFAKQLELSTTATYDSKEETISDHLSPETVEGLTSFFDKMVGSGAMETYKHLKPWMILSECESVSVKAAGLDPTKALDLVITKMATEDGKEIIEAEGADFQFGMLQNFSDEMYDMLFASYTAEYSDMVVESNKHLYEVWKAGDMEQTEKLLSSEADLTYGISDESQKELLDQYNKEMLYDRNIGMAEVAEKVLKDHENTYFMVGLAHFIGEGGILDLLEKKGYTIEVI